MYQPVLVVALLLIGGISFVVLCSKKTEIFAIYNWSTECEYDENFIMQFGVDVEYFIEG